MRRLVYLSARHHSRLHPAGRRIAVHTLAQRERATPLLANTKQSADDFPWFHLLIRLDLYRPLFSTSPLRSTRMIRLLVATIATRERLCSEGCASVQRAYPDWVGGNRHKLNVKGQSTEPRIVGGKE